jgi:hypothetical protein
MTRLAPGPKIAAALRIVKGRDRSKQAYPLGWRDPVRAPKELNSASDTSIKIGERLGGDALWERSS